METKKVILDCDSGMDNSMAVVMAVKAPQLDVKAITTMSGNYPVDVTAGSALKVLELLGQTGIPVMRGMAGPMFRKSPKDPFTHGKNGQAENFLPEPVTPLCEEHAVDLVIDLVKRYPNEIYILSTDPMNNLAIAMKEVPKIKRVIAGIYVISSMFEQNPYVFTNAAGDTPQSERNVYVDPKTASIAYHSGVRLVTLGLNVATHFGVNLTEEDSGRSRRSNRWEAKFLYQSTRFVKNGGFEAYRAVISCMAVGYTINETLVEAFQGHVGVETKDGPTLGNTAVDYRHRHVWETLPVIEIGRRVDYGTFLKILIELVLC